MSYLLRLNLRNNIIIFTWISAWNLTVLFFRNRIHWFGILVNSYTHIFLGCFSFFPDCICFLFRGYNMIFHWINSFGWRSFISKFNEEPFFRLRILCPMWKLSNSVIYWNDSDKSDYCIPRDWVCWRIRTRRKIKYTLNKEWS